MARRSHYRETRYADPPASERISVVLEMEVSTRRQDSSFQCDPSADRCMDAAEMLSSAFLQQFRECVTGEEPYKFVIHDRDSIYSKELDSSLRSLGLRVLRTPTGRPKRMLFVNA